MTQVVLLKQEDNFEEVFSDPHDPRLLEYNLHLQSRIKRHLYESQSTTIDLGKASKRDKQWDVLQVPITDNCNLLCKHCPRESKYLRKDISLENFKTYLSKFSPENFDSLLLSDFGEPLIRADLMEILRYVKAQGFKHVQIVTTGSLLTEAWCKAIVEENLLHQILISIEASSKELYEYIRGSDFELMKTNIKRLTDYKKKTGSPYPELFFNAVCLKKNIDELPGIMDLGHELGINYAYFVHLNAVPSDIYKDRKEELSDKLYFQDQHLNNCDRAHIKSIFREIDEKSKKYQIPFLPPEEYFLSPTIEPEIQEDKAEEEKGCNKPYEWAQVDPEGNVYPCCQISRRYSVGNLNDLTFEEIWDSEKFTEFREGLTNGNPNRWCAVCNVYNGKRF
jgi:radical SAM protein with 4Fe4S-binding SPASM domain